MKRLAKKIIKKIKPQQQTKLNVGCGTDYKDGWVNIDNNSDNNIEKLDLSHDLRNPLPFNDDTVDFIFNEHFVEHLTVEESKIAIKDMMRVLKPGGVLRIAMPDLELAVKAYLDPTMNSPEFLKKHGLDIVKTPAELLNMNFRWWGHKWLYDWTELDRRLRELGYSTFTKCERGKSKYGELRGLETRPESLLVVEIKK